MAKITAVCISETTGVRKTPLPDGGNFITEYGLEGDAHASSEWHRQVSLLAQASIEKMRALGIDVSAGDFAENLTTEGLELHTLPIGTRLKVGDSVLLEVSQIGKQCHTGCAIFQEIGKCIMPKEGIFARVLSGGTIRPGDSLEPAGAAGG
jgi:MOSC domain-containing protein YiiM